MTSPFLMIPLFDENLPETTAAAGLCLYSLKDKKSYNLNLPQKLKNLQCVGSCNGWLAFVDEEGNPLLHSPSSGTTIDLPPKHTLKTAGSPKIVKVVLSSHVVVVMYNHGLYTKIAFCRHGDENWRALDDCKGYTYYDVVCCDRTNTLLALGLGPTVESWDFKETTPKKTIIIQDSCPRTLQIAHQTFPTDLYSTQWYLASSPLGQIYTIVRYIGEFVRYDGEVVTESDTLTDYAAEPLVCPYKTLGFHVFRHDIDRREWVDVDSMDGFAMFLGGNQSLIVSTAENEELKNNAIYFTDDYWDRINEDYAYGGHDLGVYSIGDGSIEPIPECDHQQKIEPPPFWIALPFLDS